MVVAHRGDNSELPEQTLAAYSRAIDNGTDAIECDVRLSRDGQLVCHHDRTIERTSDGSGAISQLTLAELQKFNFAVSKYGRATTQRHQIVQFMELLKLVNDAPRKIKMLIEAKHPSRFGPQVEHALYSALAQYPDIEVFVMSFSRAAVTRYRRLDAQVPLVWLFEYQLGGPPLGATIIGPRLDQVQSRPQMIEQAHEAGRRVFVWTVNTPEDVKFVHESGADAIITDNPGMVLRTLGRQSLSALAVTNSMQNSLKINNVATFS